MKPEQEVSYQINRLAPLRGLVVKRIEVVHEGEFDEVWTQLFLSDSSGDKTYAVSVSRDPEGNGPGHLFVEEVKS